MTKKVVDPITQKLAQDSKPLPSQTQVSDNMHIEPDSPEVEMDDDIFTDADRMAVQGTNVCFRSYLWKKKPY